MTLEKVCSHHRCSLNVILDCVFWVLGLPGPPVSVRVSIVDNQPTVSWMPGTDGGSEIVGYKVEYSQKDGMLPQSEPLLYTLEIVSIPCTRLRMAAV